MKVEYEHSEEDGRKIRRKIVTDDGGQRRLVEVRFWDGTRWRDPIELLERAAVTPAPEDDRPGPDWRAIP